MFNDKKKARPAGQNPSVPTEIESAATPNQKNKKRTTKNTCNQSPIVVK